jgi:hypothetical protein
MTASVSRDMAQAEDPQVSFLSQGITTEPNLNLGVVIWERAFCASVPSLAALGSASFSLMDFSYQRNFLGLNSAFLLLRTAKPL